MREFKSVKLGWKGEDIFTHRGSSTLGSSDKSRYTRPESKYASETAESPVSIWSKREINQGQITQYSSEPDKSWKGSESMQIPGSSIDNDYDPFESMDSAASSSSSQQQLMEATKEMQEMNQSFNLQYLQLQQNMQQENRQFTMMSNIMKTKHDTAKAVINNVR
jgi:hypothetical protein